MFGVDDNHSFAPLTASIENAFENDSFFLGEGGKLDLIHYYWETLKRLKRVIVFACTQTSSFLAQSLKIAKNISLEFLRRKMTKITFLA